MSEVQPPVNPGWMTWTGRVLTVLPAAMLVMSGVMKVMMTEEVVKGAEQMGVPKETFLVLGVVEILCAVIYLVPKTAALGAILVTGYLGGATWANVAQRNGLFWLPVLLGVMAWGGLFLRDPRVRTFIPLRRGV